MSELIAKVIPSYTYSALHAFSLAFIRFKMKTIQSVRRLFGKLINGIVIKALSGIRTEHCHFYFYLAEMWGPKIKAIIFIVLISTIATAQRAMFDNVKPLRKAAVLKVIYNEPLIFLICC